MQGKLLNNGLTIPSIGMGTYPLQGTALTEAMCSAVKSGYRLFDTAHSYGNEDSFGVALQEIYKQTGVSRADLFLTTKVGEKLRYGIGDGQLFYRRFKGEEKPIYETVKAQIENSLRLFKTDYLDVVLIHWPYPDFLPEIWYSLEKIYKEGIIRAIGVSNFRKRHFERVLKEATIVPAINQINISPINTRAAQQNYCKQKNILIEVYSPLMPLKYSKIRENLILQELCLKYKCSLAQLILRWDIDQGLVPIPKSSSSLRLAQNIQLDFSIEKNDIDLISSLNENFQYLPESIYCPGY